MTMTHLPAFQQSTPVDAAAKPLTILLLGSDAREGEPVEGSRADAIVATRIETSASRVRALSVLRDTRVAIPPYGNTKINHALMLGGTGLQEQVVSGLLDIQFDGVLAVTYPVLGKIIDALGGVDVENPAAFSIQDQSFDAGRIHLGGSRAMLYARYRGDAQGDIGRAKRQQQVFAALLSLLDGVSPDDLVSIVMPELGRGIVTSMQPRQAVALFPRYRALLSTTTLEADMIPYTTTGLMHDDVFGEYLWMGTVDSEVVRRKSGWLMGREEYAIRTRDDVDDPGLRTSG